MAASSLFSQWDRQKPLDLSLDLKAPTPPTSSLPNTPESNPSTSFIPIVVEPPQRVYIPQPNIENRKGFGLLRHDRHNMQQDEKPSSPIATSPGTNLLKVDEIRKTSSRRPSLTSLLSLNRRSSNATPSADETSLVSPSTPSQSTSTALQTPLLLEKYGICQDKSVGEGATAIIRLVRRRGHDTILAAKEFRKRSRNESERQYMKRMTSEFCISKPLDHENVIQTFDLLKDDRGRWCTVLEWCAGGDVFNILKDVDLTDDEIDCLFKQLVQGVHYLHTSGVAHRDIKPENLVLTATGTLKIIDFGVADVVQSCFEKESRMCAGYVGSEPFLSPEVFTGDEYDGKALDVWSTAITWYGMQFKALPFDKAKKEDNFYTEFLAARRQRNWPPLVQCNMKERECLYGMLDPEPTRRWTIEKVLNCAWLDSVETCKFAHTSSGAEHHHYIKALDKRS